MDEGVDMILTMVKKHPVRVRMVEWTGDLAAVHELTGPANFREVKLGDRDGDPRSTAEVFDHLHDAWIGVRPGQLVIAGPLGEFYPIARDALVQLYNPESPEACAFFRQLGADPAVPS
jgi:hypothetical protein